MTCLTFTPICDDQLGLIAAVCVRKLINCEIIKPFFFTVKVSLRSLLMFSSSLSQYLPSANINLPCGQQQDANHDGRRPAHCPCRQVDFFAEQTHPQAGKSIRAKME